MKVKAFIVLDTNVLISGAYSKFGTPAKILSLIGQGNVIPIFDERMLREYNGVFHRPKFHGIFSEPCIQSTLRLIIKNGIFVNDVKQTETELVDQKDIPFFEVKESSGEFGTTLVTGNRKHYPEDDIHVYTPEAFLWLLEQMELFIHFDQNYEQSVAEVINTNIKNPKYISGENILEELLMDSPDGTLQIPPEEEAEDQEEDTLRD